MTKPVDNPEARRHSLSDWLALHELDPVTCEGLLRAMMLEPSREAADVNLTSKYQAPEIEVAWLEAAEAMRQFLPEHKKIIDDTFRNTAKIRVKHEKSRKALTLDNGPAGYPTILFSYRSEPSDHLVIAHEFAHALQLRASRGKFVSPIMRETCAFLGEGALLSHVLRHDQGQYSHLIQGWRRDNGRYFGPQRDRLEEALLCLDAPYKYWWNYPVARYLAIQISERCSRDRIWSLFEGELSVQDVLREVLFPQGKPSSTNVR